MNLADQTTKRKPLPPMNRGGSPATCRYCTANIEFVRGFVPETTVKKWLVLNRDGSFHRCRKDLRSWRYR